MENQDFYKLARNYMITNAIIGSAASKMAQPNPQSPIPNPHNYKLIHLKFNLLKNYNKKSLIKIITLKPYNLQFFYLL